MLSKSENRMIVTGMVKTSLIDYPGKIACVLFVPGCNFNCFYCHNRQIIESENGIVESDYIMDFLKKRHGLLDGVVISGGEPTLQHDLIPYIEEIKDLGYSVKLDTNGSSPAVIEEVLKRNLCDYYAVDYKAPKGRYKEICGDSADAEKVLETIGLLHKHNVKFEIRTTVVPQLGEEDLVIMGKELPIVPKYSLNLYRKPEKYLPKDSERVNKTPYAQSDLNAFAGILREYQPNVRT